MLIDSHAHLEMGDFDPDRDEVIRRAGQVGIDLIITVGTTLKDCRKAISIAHRYETVYAAVGIHPHEVKDIDETTYKHQRNWQERIKFWLLEK
jgi:TatD DNase family protein